MPPGNLLVSENFTGSWFTLGKFVDGKVDWAGKSRSLMLLMPGMCNNIYIHPEHLQIPI